MSEIMLAVLDMPNDLFWSDDPLARSQHNSVRNEAAAEIRRLRKPTHYAVIDEHGEIVHAVKIANYKDAENDCWRYRDLMSSITKLARIWTIKGVTVHEG